MKKKEIINTIAIIALALGVLYNAKQINNTETTEISSGMEAEFSQLLLENPQTIIDSLEQYKLQLAEDSAKEVKIQVKKNYDKIYSENSFVIGNPDAEIKMVEFFDYNCGYCKKSAKVMAQLVKENPNVKIYMKDIPILGANSMEAAKAAVAAGLMGKYKEYSSALMAHKGKFDEKAFRAIAEEVGLDDNELIEMTNSKKVSDILMDNRMAASIVGLQGTPTLLIETNTYRGPHTMEDLQIAIRVAMESKIEPEEVEEALEVIAE